MNRPERRNALGGALIEELTRCFEGQEGLSAFLEKREPRWREGA